MKMGALKVKKFSIEVVDPEYRSGGMIKEIIILIADYY